MTVSDWAWGPGICVRKSMAVVIDVAIGVLASGGGASVLWLPHGGGAARMAD